MKGLELEQRIRARIREFDMPALLSLLAREGYGEGDIEYRSHRTLVRQGNLVHDIQFIHVPRRRVVLTVNLGLLGLQSPLPAFFLQEMEQMNPLEAERMERFLGYFDHELLRTRFAGLYPEHSQQLLPGWEGSAFSRLSLLNLTSPSTLHWLFEQVYPEAEVQVRRKVRKQSVRTQGTQLSATALGSPTALKGFASVPTGGLEITLFVDESHCDDGNPWSQTAPARLVQKVLPLLSRTAAPLTVCLEIRSRGAPARLQQESRLGYAPLLGARERHQHSVLFQSDETPPSSPHLTSHFV